MTASNFNTGYRTLNYNAGHQAETNFTVVVSGLGRSGTTMIGKMLTAGGVPMGVPKHDVIHEDVGLSSLVENQDEVRLREVLRDRNAKHTIWGVKRPLIVQHSDLIEATFRNPRYIVIFRDPMAVGTRNNLSLGFDLPGALHVYKGQFEIVCEFVARSHRPMLLLSYEKVLNNTTAIVEEIAEFCRIEPSRRPDMLDVISPNDVSYLAETTQT